MCIRDSLPGTLVDILDFEDANEKIVEENKELPESERKEVADGKRVILGITKACLLYTSRTRLRLSRLFVRQLVLA